MRVIGFACGMIVLFIATARAASPADDLFRLVPADAGAALAVEDLRGHARSFFDSPLPDKLRQLPAVRAWFDSDQFRGFERAVRHIEKELGQPAATIRDELFGSALVLAVRIPPGENPDQARGLLLTRVANRTLLDRLIQRLNTAEVRNGQAVRGAERTWRGRSYSIREFEAPGRPSEYYALLEDNVFAWSNSEALIHDVLDRKEGRAPGLSDDPRFQRIQGRLTGRAAARLFVNPQFLKQVLTAGAPPPEPANERIGVLLQRYLDAVDYFGATLEWRPDGIVVRTEETLDADRLDPWIKHWAARPSAGPPTLDSVPASALGVAALHVDFEGLATVVGDLVPSTDQARYDNLLLVLQGLCLGRDLKTELLPKIGPAVLVTLDTRDEPSAGQPLTWVARAALGDSDSAGALRNALRTILAFTGLDPRHGDSQARVESRSVDGKEVTALSAGTPFAFEVDQGQILIGPAPEAVERHLTSASKPTTNRFEQARAAYFPKAESFLALDLVALRRLFEARRAVLIPQAAAEHHRSEADEARDFDQALGLMGLFEGAYVTSTLAPDASSVRRTLGLIAH